MKTYWQGDFLTFSDKSYEKSDREWFEKSMKLGGKISNKNKTLVHYLKISSTGVWQISRKTETMIEQPPMSPDHDLHGLTHIRSSSCNKIY